MNTRREWLENVSAGFGWLAFSALAGQQKGVVSAALAEEAAPLARAQRVIFLCMEGGPSHLDTFDYKPELTARDGEPSPAGRRGALIKASPFAFQQHGESGQWISSLFPHVARHADSLCMLKGMHTDRPNHAQACLQMHCGIFQFPRPSMGSWVVHGLGNANENLPGYVTINPSAANGGTANYSSSFLPATCQGTRLQVRGGGQSMMANLENRRRTPQEQEQQMDLLRRLSAADPHHDPVVEDLLGSWEMAFRMQSEFPEVLDFRGERRETLEMYGIDENAEPAAGGFAGPMATASVDTFGRQCLLARRLIESGVRFVEVNASGWDHHRTLEESLTASCESVDRPIAALLEDLGQRGLLEDTLVMWGGEFGRSPWAQGDGRDHNSRGFTMWLAGAGVKPGFTYGRTDDLGYEAVEGKMHIHDWHATILHLLGLDHTRLTFPYAGREMRLTDVYGDVATEILA